MIKSPMTASEINEIKNKVRAEMARRTGYGSLEEYADLTYDFSIIPEQGKRILEEHGQKTSDLLLEITDIPNLDKAIQNRYIPPGFNYQDLNSFVDNLSMEKMDGNSSSCRGACTGLCIGTCSSACSGCSGECTGCMNECTGSCGASCEGECGGTGLRRQ